MEGIRQACNEITELVAQVWINSPIVHLYAWVAASLHHIHDL